MKITAITTPNVDFEVYGHGPFYWKAYAGNDCVAEGDAENKVTLGLALYKTQIKENIKKRKKNKQNQRTLLAKTIFQAEVEYFQTTSVSPSATTWDELGELGQELYYAMADSIIKKGWSK